METITLRLPTVSCHHCIMTVKRESALVKGVEFVAGDPAAKTATFRVQGSESLAQLKVALAEAGYAAE